ncbi:hypothetical protein GE061_007564 [Apolygus lucorum]|uniref:Integrase catalytic domain-containing protein n=1 Tax=Apolygus lucorum TaxID=248454 RepID=A0A8S9WTZ0_APOLU|nr:hypothetical protein GE061_007564 [Apolygus lucorum]
MRTITSKAIIDNIINTWIARYGCPLLITTDQGRQFESAEFSEFLRKFGIQRNRTTAYHPESNGKVERWHRDLKNALRTAATSSSWSKDLPTILLGLRTTVRYSDGYSAAERTFRSPLRLPADLFTPLPTELSSEKETETTAKINRPFPEAFHTSTKMYLREETLKKGLKPLYSGPYDVINRTDKTVTLRMDGSKVTVTMNRCRPAYGFTPTLDALDIHTAAASSGTLESQTSFDTDLLLIAAETSEHEPTLHQEGTRRNIQAEEEAYRGTVSAAKASGTTTFAFKRRLHQQGEAACYLRSKTPTYAEVAGRQTAAPNHRSSSTLHHTGEEAGSIGVNVCSPRKGLPRAHHKPKMERLAHRRPNDQETSGSGAPILRSEKRSHIR